MNTHLTQNAVAVWLVCLSDYHVLLPVPAACLFSTGIPLYAVWLQTFLFKVWTNQPYALSVLQYQASLTAAAWWLQVIIWAPLRGPRYCCSVGVAVWCGPGTGWGTDRGCSTGICTGLIQTMLWREWWTCSLLETRESTTLTTSTGLASPQQPSGMETSPWSSKVTLILFHSVTADKLVTQYDQHNFVSSV